MYTKFNMAEDGVIREAKIVEIEGKGFDPEDIDLEDLQEANGNKFPGLSTKINSKGQVVPVITYIKKEEN